MGRPCSFRPVAIVSSKSNIKQRCGDPSFLLDTFEHICAATIIITGKFSNSSQHKSLEMSAIKSSLRMQREANKRMRQHIDIPKAGDDYLPRLRVDEELDVAMIHH